MSIAAGPQHSGVNPPRCGLCSEMARGKRDLEGDMSVHHPRADCRDAPPDLRRVTKPIRRDPERVG